MTRSPNSQKLIFSYLFASITSLLVLLWTLRGLSILAFIPGYVIWILLFLSIATGILRSLSR
ncbi:MAG TPA: hypothetical protein DCQ51_17865 [Planktothrix sp. UBA8407]|nr:hypothetical protein [Planktothrix sp. UBA8402]HAO12980.1 hypothetical protein [Planktothrix sp. UBA8407]HBK21973.1 hypothetical protein [Planktothrix sp. UBA10369]